MTARAAALRRDLEPFACLSGPTDEGGEVRATVAAGDVEVVVAARLDGALVASCASAVSGLYADVVVSPLAALAVHASDPAYAAALVAGVESRLVRVIANRGHARLRFGRWEVHAGQPSPSARQVVEVTAALGRRPLELADAWSSLATALGARWRGAWGTRGETAFALAAPAVTVEIQAWAEDDGTDRVHTVITHGRDRVVRPGVITDPDAIAAAILGLTGVAIAVTAPRASAAAPAPLTFADWPATRHGALDARAGRARWQPGPPIGADASRGLDERVAIGGVDVTTRCADDARLATEVAAAATGTGPLALAARPGYRFLGGLFSAAPRLDDVAFDDRYLLDTDDVAWARWWLGASEREALAATFHAEAAHPFALVVADEQVRFTAAAAPARAHLDAARHATAFLARRSARATAEWRALASALDATVVGTAFTVDGGLVVRTGRGAVAIEVTAALDARRLITIARAGQLDPAAPAPPVLTLDVARAPWPLTTSAPGDARRVDGPDGYRARTTDAAWARPRLAALASPLATARPDQLVVRGDQVTVRWAGPQLDARTLAAGVELVARLCRGGSLAAAPYR